MDVRNCRDCKRLFNYVGGPRLCPECNKKLESKFVEVKEYIYNNPSASLYQIAEETEVPVAQIKDWIREERLAFTQESNVTFQCDSCGKPIVTGRYCKECKLQLIHNLKGIYTGKEADLAYISKGDEKMRFIGKNKVQKKS